VIEIAFVEREGLLDAQTGAPHDHDQPAQTPAVRSVARGTHHRDDLFDLRRIGRIAQTLVAWSMAGVKARQRGRRSTSTGTIEQQLGHDPSSGSLNEPDYRLIRSAPTWCTGRTVACDAERQS
jgi:hypothetical protein